MSLHEEELKKMTKEELIEWIQVFLDELKRKYNEPKTEKP